MLACSRTGYPRAGASEEGGSTHTEQNEIRGEDKAKKRGRAAGEGVKGEQEAENRKGGNHEENTCRKAQETGKGKSETDEEETLAGCTHTTPEQGAPRTCRNSGERGRGEGGAEQAGGQGRGGQGETPPQQQRTCGRRAWSSFLTHSQARK